MLNSFKLSLAQSQKKTEVVLQSQGVKKRGRKLDSSRPKKVVSGGGGGRKRRCLAYSKRGQEFFQGKRAHLQLWRGKGRSPEV